MNSTRKFVVPTEFWNALAPYHAALEDNYLDRASIRAILGMVEAPVLVVGAGQGLIVAELRQRGFQCEGLDLSAEMIRYAKLRRGLTLVEADARAMPLGEATQSTVIYATGVVDFMRDEEEIRTILNEGQRVLKPSGKRFVAFYRLSRAGEQFMARIGLLENHLVSLKKSMEMYRLTLAQMVPWVAAQAGMSCFQAAVLLFSLSVRNTLQEKIVTFRMQKIFRDPAAADALLQAAPEKQPYRNEAEIRNLFKRLAIPLRQMHALRSCWIAQI